jgi:hypothetical protein
MLFTGAFFNNWASAAYANIEWIRARVQNTATESMQ